ETIRNLEDTVLNGNAGHRALQIGGIWPCI
ncbi:MAG: hypothetical protein ACI82H_002093, partial [Alphaproteobacteria bacterium]